jgi:hypothetical protein
VRVVGPLDAEFLVQLRAQRRVGAIQRSRQATEFLDRSTDQLRADCLRWGAEVVDGGLGDLPGCGDLRDPLADDGRVGAGLKRGAVAAKAPGGVSGAV